jgi:hypothetical protein
MRLPSTSNLLPPLPNYNTNTETETETQRGKESAVHCPKRSPLGNVPGDPLCCERLAAPQNSATQFQVRPVRAGIDGLLMLILLFSFQIRVPVMDEVIDAFELLALELPDPEQELSPQNLGPKLETFTIFPKLPIELRRMIWRLTFPSRRMIDLTLALQHLGRFCTRRRPADPKLPVALHVNQESRSIALKTYYILFQQQPRWVNKRQPTGMRPICFDPRVDLVLSDLNDILVLMLPGKVFGKDLECLNLIKTLEIRNFRWNVEAIWNGKCTADALYYSKGGVLKYLRGLEEIHLVSRPEDVIFDDPVEDSEDCFWWLKSCFDELRKSDPEREPFPVVWLHDFRRRKTRSDKEQMEDERIGWPWICALADERESSDSG